MVGGNVRSDNTDIDYGVRTEVSYEPSSFWSNYAKNIIDNIDFDNSAFQLQLTELMKVLYRIQPFETVLEIGPGTGRITDLMLHNFNDIKEYTVLEISSDMVNKLLGNIKPRKHFNIIIGDISRWETLDKAFGNKKYDLVLAVEVLMHIKPEDIFNVLGSMLYLAKRDVVHVDYSTDTKEELQPHNFNHNYEEMYSKYRKHAFWKNWIRNWDTYKIGNIKQKIFHLTVSSIYDWSLLDT